MIVTTSDEVPGRQATKYLGYVWGTSVQSKFFGHDVLAVLRGLIGGEITTYTCMINDAKHEVIQRLVANARALGADAVVCVRMGSGQVSPGMIEIFAYGTAVKLKKK
ncbi:MAG: YbjQ family protein [Candidatus Diapherotrites archaeon]|nr:YbjQ family protein [Candidatus Diapherotrites archaeon]